MPEFAFVSSVPTPPTPLTNFSGSSHKGVDTTGSEDFFFDSQLQQARQIQQKNGMTGKSSSSQKEDSRDTGESIERPKDALFTRSFTEQGEKSIPDPDTAKQTASPSAWPGSQDYSAKENDESPLNSTKQPAIAETEPAIVETEPAIAETADSPAVRQAETEAENSAGHKKSVKDSAAAANAIPEELPIESSSRNGTIPETAAENGTQLWEKDQGEQKIPAGSAEVMREDVRSIPEKKERSSIAAQPGETEQLPQENSPENTQEIPDNSVATGKNIPPLFSDQATTTIAVDSSPQEGWQAVRFSRNIEQTTDSTPIQQADLTLNRLQKIINAGNETGTVSVTITQTTLQTNTLESGIPVFSGPPTINGKEIAKGPEHSQTAQLFRILEETENRQSLLKETTTGFSAKNQSETTSPSLSAEQWTVSSSLAAGKKDGDVKFPQSPEKSQKGTGLFIGGTGAAENIDPALEEGAKAFSVLKTSEKDDNQKAVDQVLVPVTKNRAEDRQEKTSNDSGNRNPAPATTLLQSDRPEREAKTQQNTSSPWSQNMTTAEGEILSLETGTSTFLGVKNGTSETGTTEPTLPQTITLPSGRVVREHEVVRQFLDKFQINGRNLESKINIKLQPAELGEIKIDITVKEGSIKANVIAQSQITQTILERNLEKLKNIFEAEGFSVDEITIGTKEQQTTTAFDFFGEESTEQEKNTFSKNKNTGASQQDETGQQREQNDSQVNLRV